MTTLRKLRRERWLLLVLVTWFVLLALLEAVLL